MTAETSKPNSTSALEALIHHPDFVRLGDLARQPRPFNMFEAVGLARQELRHSDLLAFLLDPNRPHGLGAAFTRALLCRAAALLAQPVDANGLHLDGLEVRREWNFIDILVESPADQLAVIIENKIDTSEHSDQLGRYYRLVRKHRPGWHVIGIYLTLDGVPPASAADRDYYIPLGYSDIAAILLELAANPQLTPDVEMLLRHYVQLIRSELVPEPNADQALLGRRLYMEHRAALDAILQARDARMRMIQRYFDDLFATTVRDHPGLLSPNKYYTNASLPRWHSRFAPLEWEHPMLRVSTPWTNKGIVLVFEFMHSPQQIHLSLTVGPAREAQDLRQKLYDLAQRRVGGLFPAWNAPSDDWFGIYTRSVFAPESGYFAEAGDDMIRAVIYDHWQSFLRDDLPAIQEVIREHILPRN